jgi:dTMP kinase
MFISFEGIEGSGKSTLLAQVHRALQAAGHDVVAAREPGGTRAGDAVRNIFLQPGLPVDAMTELMLINASRAQLVFEVIDPSLRSGSIVLCDRYVHSTLAYQGYGRGLPLDLVRSVCDAATRGRMPDLTLLVDVTLDTSLTRLSARTASVDRVEQEDRDFHRRVREGFLELAARDPRVVPIDGEREQDEVFGAAMAALSAVIA